METWADFAKVQPVAAKMIMNSFQKKRLSHAYLIQGARGTGKKTLAQLMILTLFCENLTDDVHPCFTCLNCKRISSGNHPDVHWIKPEATDHIKKEQIDYMRKEFTYMSFEAERKVYVIEKSEAMTVKAANQLLKFLEEPDITSTAILLSEQPQQIIPTIRSRCQTIDLKPLSERDFQHKLLALNLPNMTEAKARLLSSITLNLDEATMLHEAENVYQVKELVYALFQQLLQKYEERYLFVHQKWLAQLTDRKEQQLGIELLLVALRDIMYKQLGSTDALMFFQEDDPVLSEATLRFSQTQLMHMIEYTLQAKQQLASNVHPVLTFEQLILQF